MGQLSGQITVPTAGTAVQGPDIARGAKVAIKALSGNTGSAYFGNDGADDVAAANGFEMAPTDLPVVIELRGISLADLWFDVTTSGNGFSWLIVG